MSQKILKCIYKEKSEKESEYIWGQDSSLVFTNETLDKR